MIHNTLPIDQYRTFSSDGVPVKPSVTVSRSTPLTEGQFIDKCLKAIDEGYRVIPFVGAGLSQASGIPTVKDLHRYLTFCVWLMLGGPYSGKPQAKDGPLWEPRSKDWPKIGVHTLFEYPKGRWDTTDLASQIHELLITLTDEKEYSLVLEAYGSLANWRTALNFLSRVTSAECRRGKLVIKLFVPDNSIIDSFFLSQVEKKEPNLGHRLLVGLLPFLRANLIFTTNFDDLLEKAFNLSGRHPLLNRLWANFPRHS